VDFMKKLETAEAEALALQSVSVETAFAPALGKLGDACKACHQTYRLPKN
jgi:cytochrome c556